MRRARGADGALLESAFQAQVIGLARFYGWRIYHAPAGGTGSRRDGTHRVDREQVGRGFPDLVLVRPPELLFVELKADAGRLGPGQAEWLDELGQVADGTGRKWDDAGDPLVEVHLWRPRDWPDLERRLASGRVLQAVPPPL